MIKVNDFKAISVPIFLILLHWIEYIETSANWRKQVNKWKLDGNM